MKRFLIAVVITGAVLTGCNPTEYEVSREVMIDAPAEQVFAIVNDFHNQHAWSPWEQMDPEIVTSFEGAESGVGAIYKWSGNDSVGTGRMEILESEPNSYVIAEMVFTDPWESTSLVEFHLSEEDGATRTRWVNRGSLPGFMFWMGEEDMDEMMGPNFETGLQQLKVLSEERAASSSSTLPTEVLETNIAALNYYFVEREVGFDELGVDLFSEGYEEVYNYLGEDAANAKAPPFAVFHKWDEENGRVAFEIAVATESDKAGNDVVKRGTSYQGNVVMRIVEGSYEKLDVAHEEIHAFIGRNELQFNGSPWESYVVGPGDDRDSTRWITEIYYPVTEQ